MNHHVKEVLKAVCFGSAALFCSAIISAHLVKDEVEEVVNNLEDGIQKYDNKSALCRVHSELQVQMLYFASNPFRDYTKFNETVEVCKEYL